MSAVRRTSSTKLSGNATLFLQLDYGDTAAALGAQTYGRHVGMAFQEARDGLAQPALAEHTQVRHPCAAADGQGRGRRLRLRRQAELGSTQRFRLRGANVRERLGAGLRARGGGRALARLDLLDGLLDRVGRAPGRF